MLSELPEYMLPVLQKHDRAYREYRSQFTDAERLRTLDEAHSRFLHDLATDIEEAYEKGRLEGTAIRMKRNGLPVNDIAKYTGLSSDEIDRLD